MKWKKRINATKSGEASDVGTVYHCVKDLVLKRSIPAMPERSKLTVSDPNTADPVESPAVCGLQNLYKDTVS
jgi:hypothetical protein